MTLVGPRAYREEELQEYAKKLNNEDIIKLINKAFRTTKFINIFFKHFPNKLKIRILKKLFWYIEKRVMKFVIRFVHYLQKVINQNIVL